MFEVIPIFFKKKRFKSLIFVAAFNLGYGLANRSVADADLEPIPAGANIFVSLAKKVVPTVVNISTKEIVGRSGRPGPGRMGPGPRQNPDDMFRDFFERFFRQDGQNMGPGQNGGGIGPRFDDGDDSDSAQIPNDQGPRDLGPGHKKNDRKNPRSEGSEGSKEKRPLSLGTGFVIDTSGLILTNNHVIDGADEVTVSFTEDQAEKPTECEIVGRDPELDLALLRAKTDRKFVALPFGDSDALNVGEYVLAVGNPFGQGHSVTHGIISAKGRVAPPELPFAKYLQTDAPINPGNSGGPLVNLRGEVIGINNAIDARAQGIGFAIPINSVKIVLEQLKAKGFVTRGYIGVQIDELRPEIAEKIGLPKDLSAPIVMQVNPGEPADKAGLKPYDAIIEVNGKKVVSFSELLSNIGMIPVGTSVPVKVNRAGKLLDLKITVTERPTKEERLSKGGGLRKPKDSLKENRKDGIEERIGATLADLSEDTKKRFSITDANIKGVIVLNISGYQGPADKAGLSKGDVILEVDQKPIENVKDLEKALSNGKSSALLRVRSFSPGSAGAYSVIILNLDVVP